MPVPGGKCGYKIKETIRRLEQYPEMKLIKQEQFWDSDEENLIENCKQRIIKLGGPIRLFIDRTPKDKSEL
jgi:hypothetical protein